MFTFLGFALAALSLMFGYTAARNFVRTRLRYVDAIRTLKAPLAAGIGAAVLASLPFAVIPLPFFTVGTAALFGVSVAAGVRAGAKDIESGRAYIEGP
ncbi:MAG TPA: hypothetical protein VE967_16845 [Gemmatimonadaceae bacterium]|nr:hypothetical protein [Gemmatimonadaceae bacterium]